MLPRGGGIGVIRGPEALSLLETLLDAVHTRLSGTAARAHDPVAVVARVAELAQAVRDVAVHILPGLRDPGSMARAGTLLTRVATEVDPYQQELQRAINRAAGVPGSPISDGNTDPAVRLAAVVAGDCATEARSGWQHEPRLSWLLEGAWLNAPALQARYGCTEEYVETLQSLMTLLTFYWGAGAVWPRCRHRPPGQGEGATCCNEPLLAVAAARGKDPERLCGARLPGGGGTCRQAAVWLCPRRGHTDGMCAKCVRRHQAALSGRPGPHASTDIYDAVVERETSRRDGQ
eukprot:gene14114-16691_t